MDELESSNLKGGEPIQFFIQRNAKIPVFLEIMGRIDNLSRACDKFEILNLNSEERSLLLFNVPACFTREQINNVFGCFGPIKEIKMNKSDQNSVNFNFADSSLGRENSWVYIVFEGTDSIEKLREESIKKHENSVRRLYINGDENFFSDKNTFNLKNKLYNISKLRVNPELLQKDVDSYMTNYDIEREIEEENLRAESKVPDEDGFIRVVGKKQKAPDGTVVHSFEPENSIKGFKTKKQINKKEKKKLYEDFYKFQIRENKKREIQKLNY
ncbi:ribosomal RNA-processing protein 7 A [Cryptosporidium felis]|nr:ribosomal RNA-processing protein 7 A [Cryptosporidium felis]